VKSFVLLLAVFLAAPQAAHGLERLHDSALTSAPAQELRAERAKGRSLASVPSREEKGAENKALFERLKAGDTVVIQHSFPGWEDQLAEITDKYEDGRVRIRLNDGKRAYVAPDKLASTLSPETDCGESHGVQICKGDEVYYPARSTSLKTPEAPVAHVFENGTVVVKDGADFVMDLKQVGKSVNCSPQKENVCVGDVVHAEGYKNDQPITFEGPVEKIYSHGVVLVRTDGLWRFPIDVTAVTKRIDTEPKAEADTGGRGLASIPEAEYPELLPVEEKVIPEIEPLNLHKADQLNR
jgi:hypothetical protein